MFVSVIDLSKIWPLLAAKICGPDCNAGDDARAKELLDFPWWHFKFCIHMSTVGLKPLENPSHWVGTELSS